MEHSGHDINLLLSRWDRLAVAHDWVRSNLGTVGGLPVEVFFNEKAAKKKATKKAAKKSAKKTVKKSAKKAAPKKAAMDDDPDWAEF